MTDGINLVLVEIEENFRAALKKCNPETGPRQKVIIEERPGGDTFVSIISTFKLVAEKASSE
jgi:hypothetical protein